MSSQTYNIGCNSHSVLQMDSRGGDPGRGEEDPLQGTLDPWGFGEAHAGGWAKHEKGRIFANGQWKVCMENKILELCEII